MVNEGKEMAARSVKCLRDLTFCFFVLFCFVFFFVFNDLIWSANSVVFIRASSLVGRVSH